MKRMTTTPKYITVHCARQGCTWEGLDDASPVMADKLAKEHITHTEHSVTIETRYTWLMEDDGHG